MIPNQSLETYPEFANNGTKTAPDDAKYAAGFAQADVLPAEWMNWAWGKNTRCITALNAAAASIEKEINNVLTAGGATPSVSDNTQLREAIKYIIGTIAAPIAHASPDSTYGLGSTSQFGHVKATAENGLSITNGNIAMDKASTSGYGASEIIDALTQTTTGDGLALSARQGYVLASNMFGNGTATVNNDEGTIAVTLTNYPNITELMAGARFRVVFTNDFTFDGQATMTINSQPGTAQLVTVGNVANGTGAFQSGKSYEFCYTGANYDCLSNLNIYRVPTKETITLPYTVKRNGYLITEVLLSSTSGYLYLTSILFGNDYVKCIGTTSTSRSQIIFIPIFTGDVISEQYKSNVSSVNYYFLG